MAFDYHGHDGNVPRSRVHHRPQRTQNMSCRAEQLQVLPRHKRTFQFRGQACVAKPQATSAALILTKARLLSISADEVGDS